MEFLSLLPTDARLSWHGIVGLETTTGGTTPRRLPPFARELFPSDAADSLWERAGMPTGVRIVFQTDSPVVGGHYVSNTDLTSLDLFCDGEFIASHPLGAGDEFRFGSLPTQNKPSNYGYHMAAFLLCAICFWRLTAKLPPLPSSGHNG